VNKVERGDEVTARPYGRDKTAVLQKTGHGTKNENNDRYKEEYKKKIGPVGVSEIREACPIRMVGNSSTSMLCDDV
jgi:hypothetical protein